MARGGARAGPVGLMINVIAGDDWIATWSGQRSAPWSALVTAGLDDTVYGGGCCRNELIMRPADPTDWLTGIMALCEPSDGRRIDGRTGVLFLPTDGVPCIYDVVERCACSRDAAARWRLEVCGRWMRH